MGKKAKIVLVLTCIVCFFALVSLYFAKFVNPVITSYCEATIENMAVRAITDSVTDVIGGGSIYNDLITITHDEEGNVKSILTNSVAINKLTHKLLDVGQIQLETISKAGVPIALGNFSGIPILSGRGPNVTIKVTPVGSMDVVFKSKFTESGINQTNHQIILNVKSTVSLILPANSSKIVTTTEIVVGESVIVGKIPNVYLNSSQPGSLLNLVP